MEESTNREVPGKPTKEIMGRDRRMLKFIVPDLARPSLNQGETAKARRTRGRQNIPQGLKPTARRTATRTIRTGFQGFLLVLRGFAVNLSPILAAIAFLVLSAAAANASEFILRPAITLTEEYDDNIFLTP